jgi:hypothetical protein
VLHNEDPQRFRIGSRYCQAACWRGGAREVFAPTHKTEPSG